MGATLHRIVEEFDAGPILSKPTAPLPAWVTPESVMEMLGSLIDGAIEEGTARAVAGDPGTPQDEARMTYAAPFTRRSTGWIGPRARRSCSAEWRRSMRSIPPRRRASAGRNG